MLGYMSRCKAGFKIRGSSVSECLLTNEVAGFKGGGGFLDDDDGKSGSSDVECAVLLISAS